MMQHRILFVTHAAVLGGAELSLLDLAAAYRQTSEVLLFADGPLTQALQDRGIQYTILPAAAQLLNVKTHSRLAALRSLPAVLRLAQQVVHKAQQGFDFIHVNSPKALVVVALASMLQPLPPIIWHLRDILTASYYSAVNRRAAIFLANRQVTKVIANSQATAAAFVAAGGQPSRVEVVYNGINPAPFAIAQTAQCQQIRQALGIGDAPVIGVFSRLSFWKGQHLVLQALQHLPGVHVLMVGDALFGETDYVDELRSLTQQLNLGDRVHWLGFRQDIPTLMHTCDYIVHPSTEPEPFGRVLVEALLARRPVVAAAAGGALEIIQDQRTGLLFAPNHVPGLVNSLQQMIQQPETLQDFVQAGYSYALQKFSFKASRSSFDLVLNAL